MINSQESFHFSSCSATEIFSTGDNGTCLQERLTAIHPTLQELMSMTRSAFKSNDLALFWPHRLMLRETAEPLFTPVRANLVKQTSVRELL
jgi:hypothetical protein